MATEKTANEARQKHAESLRKLGAHAIEVNKRRRSGKNTYVVIAHFEKKPAKDTVPTELSVKVGPKVVQVPLVTEESERFQAE